MIAERIKMIREQKGMTQKQLAERCGMATGTIQQYELNKREPRQEQLDKIAEALDVDIFDLIGKETVKSMDNIVLKLETYMFQQSENEMLSENGKWLAKRIIEECIKIVKSGGVE